MSRVALSIAGVYLIIATGVAVSEAMAPPSVGWISLRYMETFLATFPVSVPMAMIGIQPSLDNKLTVTALLAASTAIIYGIVNLIVWLFTLK